MYPELNRTTLVEWLAYLEQLHPETVDMGLERVNLVRQELGLSTHFPIIIVGGTNGKGSVCATLESILVAGGYHTGCYTSPHLIRYNERIRIQQKEAADQQLLHAFACIDQARKKCGVSLTYFEFGTLAAMVLFVNAHVDVAILEVGLGGRLDAVNIFDADCAVLTSIDLDHQNYLGDSREAIGFEKAGIFRTDKPAICSETSLPVTVRQYAKAINSRLVVINQDFGFVQKQDTWDFWSDKGWWRTLPLPVLHGVHQLRNASASLMALALLSENLPISLQAIREGLLKVFLPGRFQVVSSQPLIVLDVAHNPAAARTFAENLGMVHSTGKTFAVLAMLQDKDITGVVQELKQHVDIWLLSPIDVPRGANTRELVQNLHKADMTDKNHEVYEFKDIISAYVFACEQAAKNDRICVLGSFNTVGAVLRFREQENHQ